MESIVLAFGDLQLASRCRDALSGAGISVQAVCNSLPETLRMLSQLEQGGIVVSGYQLLGGNARRLREDMPAGYSLLLIATPREQEALQGGNVFFLAHPPTRGALINAVRMIQRLRRRSQPRSKAEAEQSLVDKAKDRLMETGYTEEEAHRFLQRGSMRSGLRIGEYARLYLEEKTHD